MLELHAEFGRASLGTFWAPVIVWTAITGMVALALSVTRGLQPLVGYRLRQGMLCALPASVAAVPWVPGLDLLAPTLVGELGGAFAAAPRSNLAASVGSPTPVTDSVGILFGLATIAAALLAAVRLLVLARDLHRLRRLRVTAPVVSDAATNHALAEVAERMGVRRPVRLLEGPSGCVPMTFHCWRPAIVIPRSLIGDPASLRIVLAHELIHVRRHDYAWALLDSLVSAAFAFHPLVRFLRRGTERCRETSCDAEILAAGVARPDEYAEVLVQAHADLRSPKRAIAASLSTRSSTIKERLETMKRFADNPPTPRLRWGTALASVALFLATATLGACVSRTEQTEMTEVAPPREGHGVRQVTPSTESREAMREAEIERLDAELAYLRERMDELRDRQDAIPKLGPGRQPGPEDYPAYADLVQHQILLNEMYTERLRTYETVRMNQVTERRLEGRGS